MHRQCRTESRPVFCLLLGAYSSYQRSTGNSSKPVLGLVLVQCAMPILILFAPEALIAAILIAIGTIRGENGSF